MEGTAMGSFKPDFFKKAHVLIIEILLLFLLLCGAFKIARTEWRSIFQTDTPMPLHPVFTTASRSTIAAGIFMVTINVLTTATLVSHPKFPELC
jgi:hypothetical protein